MSGRGFEGRATRPVLSWAGPAQVIGIQGFSASVRTGPLRIECQPSVAEKNETNKAPIHHS